MPSDPKIRSVEEFISRVGADYSSWNTKTFPWFRGEPLSETPLLPKLYRVKFDGTRHSENPLLQFFRMKAPSLAPGLTPPRSEHTDQWLFLAQHVGLPTRLLDWSEGALVALYFALLERRGVVWMLHPIRLNNESGHCEERFVDFGENEFPLTWVQHGQSINIGSENIRGAWENDSRGIRLPVAVHPTNIHPRMSSQRSCFTVHGKEKESINTLISSEILKSYELDPRNRDEMMETVRMLGISHSTIFPDLDGLAKDLAKTF